MNGNQNPNSEVCPYCQGLGVVSRDVPLDHPDFGKAFPCVCQTEVIKTRKADRARKLGHLDAYSDRTFNTFQVDYRLLDEDGDDLRRVFPDMPDGRNLNEDQRHQVNIAAKIALHYAENPQGWLLFQGKYGTGKTHLAAAIANYRLAQNEPVLFMTVPDLLDHLRSTYAPDSEITYDALFEQMSNIPLVILDDMGAESPTPWAQEKLYQLLSRRHTLRLPTVITTNIDPDRFEPRIRSRVLDYTLTQSIPLDIPDQRAMGGWQELDLTNLSRYRDMTFDTFDLRQNEGLPESDAKRLQQAVQAAHYFVENPSGWLVLMGEPGTGKTHLAAATAYECKQRDQQVMFVTASELLDYLRATFYPASTVTYDKRLEEIKRASLLILDNLTLDTKGMSSWARDKLFEILIYRFDYNLPTIITTYQKLNEMDIRLKSRITNEAHSTIIVMTVPSYPGKPIKRAALPRKTR